MTNEELIAKIKEEINYRIETYIGNAQSCIGTTLVDGLEEVSDFLSDLEKSLPTQNAGDSSEIPKDLDVAAIQAAQSDMQDRQIMEASNDERILYSRIFRRGFKAGSKWQKEQDDSEKIKELASAYQLGIIQHKKQMMKEAVEGDVAIVTYPNKYKFIDCEVPQELNEGDKVRIIIVKED